MIVEVPFWNYKKGTLTRLTDNFQSRVTGQFATMPLATHLTRSTDHFFQSIVNACELSEGIRIPDKTFAVIISVRMVENNGTLSKKRLILNILDGITDHDKLKATDKLTKIVELLKTTKPKKLPALTANQLQQRDSHDAKKWKLVENSKIINNYEMRTEAFDLRQTKMPLIEYLLRIKNFCGHTGPSKDVVDIPKLQFHAEFLPFEMYAVLERQEDRIFIQNHMYKPDCVIKNGTEKFQRELVIALQNDTANKTMNLVIDIPRVAKHFLNVSDIYQIWKDLKMTIVKDLAIFKDIKINIKSGPNHAVSTYANEHFLADLIAHLKKVTVQVMNKQMRIITPELYTLVTAAMNTERFVKEFFDKTTIDFLLPIYAMKDQLELTEEDLLENIIQTVAIDSIRIIVLRYPKLLNYENMEKILNTGSSKQFEQIMKDSIPDLNSYTTNEYVTNKTVDIDYDASNEDFIDSLLEKTMMEEERGLDDAFIEPDDLDGQINDDERDFVKEVLLNVIEDSNEGQMKNNFSTLLKVNLCNKAITDTVKKVELAITTFLWFAHHHSNELINIFPMIRYDAVLMDALGKTLPGWAAIAATYTQRQIHDRDNIQQVANKFEQMLINKGMVRTYKQRVEEFEKDPEKYWSPEIEREDQETKILTQKYEIKVKTIIKRRTTIIR